MYILPCSITDDLPGADARVPVPGDLRTGKGNVLHGEVRAVSDKAAVTVPAIQMQSLDGVSLSVDQTDELMYFMASF